MSARLRQAFTGAYRPDSNGLQHDGEWSLGNSASGAILSTDQQGATARIDFSGTRLDLILSEGDARSLNMTVDGHAISLKTAGTTPDGTRFVVASRLSDESHQAVLAATGNGAVGVSEFVVSRRTIMSWIYPWIYAALALTLLLNLASLGWILRSRRRVSVEQPAPGTVVSARELRANRMTSQRHEH